MLKPKIRFKEFNGCYTINKLKNIASFLHGKGLSWSDVLNNGAFECILYGNLYTNYGMIIESEIEYRTNRQLKNPVYSKVGDVLIPSSDTTPTGLARATSIEKENVLLGGGINIIRPNKTINGSYLSLLLNCYKSELIKLIKGTTVRHIYNEDIKEISLPILDNIDEQTQTVKLIKNIEKIINQSNRRIKKWKNIRTSFLSKMFPKPDSRVPEIRFKGFSGEWEEYHLNDITDYYNGKSHEDNQNDNGKYELINLNSVSIEGGLKSSGKFLNYAEETLKKNDLVMILSDVGHGDLLGRVALIPVDNKYVLNQRVALLRINKRNVIPRYLYYFINVHQQYFKILGAGSSQLNIGKEVVESFRVLLPNIEEQKAIAQFLYNLDKNIEYQQQKLEKLKQIKESFLSKMFV